LQHGAEVVERFSVVRAQFDGTLVCGRSTLKLLLIARGKAEAKVCFSIAWIECQRTFKRECCVLMVTGETASFAFLEIGINFLFAMRPLTGQATEKRAKKRIRHRSTLCAHRAGGIAFEPHAAPFHAQCIEQ